MTRATLLGLVLVLGCALAATAEEGAEPAVARNSLGGALTLGEHWYGPEVAKEDLQGKVILFIIWGS